MNPAALIPIPDSIPVSWGWLQLFSTITFFLHVVMMNIMLGTAMIAFVNQIRAGRAEIPVSRDISKELPFAIAFTINFGVAPLLFTQVLYGHFLYTSSVLMAVFWLSVIPTLIAAYYLAYIFNLKYDALGTVRTLVIGGSVLLLLLIAFIFTNNLTLMQRPESWHRFLARPDGWLLNLDDATLIPRYLHFVLSALALGGISIALFYEFRGRRGDPDAKKWVRHGSNWFTYATLANFGIGFWFFMALPATAHDFSTTLGKSLAISIIAGIGAGILSIVFGWRARPRPAFIWTLITIFIMIISRELTRAIYLHPYFTPSDLTVTGQYSPFILFLAFFLGGLVLIAWMVKTAFFSGRAE